MSPAGFTASGPNCCHGHLLLVSVGRVDFHLSRNEVVGVDAVGGSGTGDQLQRLEIGMATSGVRVAVGPVELLIRRINP